MVLLPQRGEAGNLIADRSILCEAFALLTNPYKKSHRRNTFIQTWF